MGTHGNSVLWEHLPRMDRRLMPTDGIFCVLRDNHWICDTFVLARRSMVSCQILQQTVTISLHIYLKAYQPTTNDPPASLSLNPKSQQRRGLEASAPCIRTKTDDPPEEKQTFTWKKGVQTRK
ncbi:uncharacterized protein CLUP02_14305 [Colletotrichum lupini]|uniref:Uncharacterized protein n=1 Tax=Colletotrichum lupini TaxID=145971 RepID=A0A9Q8T4R7_9PEZI|nr:uncharacterized protein CLUP02_14305 [Colletotrichum lupini]UQC88780.1 hypothetical protein CLUP02_14305 [Colletotrichum lupini]